MASDAGQRSLSALYSVQPAPRNLRPMMNGRRDFTVPFPFQDLEIWDLAKRKVFERTGLTDYVNTVVAEQASRPVVEVSPPEKYAAGFDVYKKWAPMLLDWIFRHTRKVPFTFNKRSRLGAPWCIRVPSKRDLLMPQFRDLLAGGDPALIDALRGLYTLINVRLQPEKAGRVRSMTFVSADGAVYETDIGAQQRFVTHRSSGIKGEAQRTRTIFNPCFLNLLLQFLDSVLHEPLLATRACKHNMFGRAKEVIPLGVEAVLCTDIRHMDRHTGACATYRAQIIGGAYETIFTRMFAHPFLVPSDDWTKNFWIWSRGVTQFPSGFSMVANLQKEFVLCLLFEFIEQTRHYTPERCLEFVLNAGDGRFAIANYGDDNAFGGDKAVLDSWLAFGSQYCAIEPETPPKFLGFEWFDHDRTFRLTAKSYLLKNWLNERQPYSTFRPYASLGLTLKRRAYLEHGDPTVMREIYAIEDAVLAEYGPDWSFIEERAVLEAKLASEMAMTPYSLLGKEYLLTAEQRAALPGYELVPQDEASDMARRLTTPALGRKMYGEVGGDGF